MNDKRPNILWYCTDQQRFDTINALGNVNAVTPNLDRLVASGTAFTRCYTQSPICTPSRATFLTGRYPATHHVHRNGADYFPACEQLVTATLAEAGYDCGLAGKLHLSRAKNRIERRPNDGYRVFHWSHHPHPDWRVGHGYADWLEREKGVDPIELYRLARGQTCCTGVPEELHQTTWCTEKTVDFIREERAGPWLMSVNPFDPHPPFDPPRSYLDHFDPESLPYPLFRESDIAHQRKFASIDQQTVNAVSPYDTSGADNGQATQDPASVPPAHYDARAVKAAYYAMIELIDSQFGRILDCLEETGQLNNTIIIFTSDHGELLGDHGLIYKGCRFYEGLVHVPLIISWPRAWRGNTRVEDLVELVDLAPTLLEAVGIDSDGDRVQGRSLVHLMDGSAHASPHKPCVVSEYYDAVDLPNATHATMVFDGRHKSVVYHGTGVGELYDLHEDPGEFVDLWDAPEARDMKAEILHRHLEAVMATSGPGVRRTDSY